MKPQLDADGKETGVVVSFCRFKLVKDPVTGADVLAPGLA